MSQTGTATTSVALGTVCLIWSGPPNAHHAHMIFLGAHAARCRTLQFALFDFDRINDAVPGRSSMTLEEISISRYYFSYIIFKENMQIYIV